MQERVEWDAEADNYLRVGGNEEDVLMNVLTDDTPEDATVTAQIRDRSGAVVTGLNALNLAHDTGTTGESTSYTAVVSAANCPPVGQYIAEVTAVKGGITGTKFVPITVRRG
jgi:hypothetical protein